MQSLLDLYNMREGRQRGSDLLEFYQGKQQTSPDLVDRATFLPVGQYEDGSLTPAIPGAVNPLVEWGRHQFEQNDNFDLMAGVPAATHIARTLMDPWGTAKDVAGSAYDFLLRPSIEGAQRSLVAQEGAPLFDDGGQYVSGANMEPLDAFNAASLAPILGVGVRAAGMARDMPVPTARHEPMVRREMRPLAEPAGEPLPALGLQEMPQPERFAAFRERISGLDPTVERAWAGSTAPERYGTETPFEFVERPKIYPQSEPYEADIDLRTLQTKQSGVWGHKVKSMADSGVRPRRVEDGPYGGGSLPWVRRTEDGGYVLVDGNHRMSAEVVKGNDFARALVFANPSETALPSLFSDAMQEPQDGGLLQFANASPGNEFAPQREPPRYDTRPGDLSPQDRFMIEDLKEQFRGVPREQIPGHLLPLLQEPVPVDPPAPGNLISLLTRDLPQAPRDNTIPTGREDPFDRYNDPWGEVPMILQNPFADPPPPELPRLPRPLPFLLGPVG